MYSTGGGILKEPKLKIETILPSPFFDLFSFYLLFLSSLVSFGFSLSLSLSYIWRSFSPKSPLYLATHTHARARALLLFVYLFSSRIYGHFYLICCLLFSCNFSRVLNGVFIFTPLLPH